MPTPTKDPTAWHGVMHPSGLTLAQRQSAIADALRTHSPVEVEQALQLAELGWKPNRQRVRYVSVPVPRHLGQYTPYALLLIAFVLVATSSTSLLVGTCLHVMIGAGAMLCAWLGGKVCSHRRHQVAATVALLILEAWTTMQVVG